MDPVTLFSPAKLNLSLAVTGRRPDGFHDLVSVAVTLAWGDTLRARRLGRKGPGELRCEAPGVPTDATNLVLRAAALFATQTGWDEAVGFDLEKRIPAGAGLGGGSGNAVAALDALVQLSGITLPVDVRLDLAARLGSDCPLFCAGQPVIMRGRGERLTPLPPEAAGRLRGRRVLVVKPTFGVETGPAYQALAARPDYYADAAGEEARVASWLTSPAAPAEALLANTFEHVVFPRWPALPALAEILRDRHGLALRLSGSGSACFALLTDNADPTAAIAEVRSAWGDHALVVETRIA